MGIQNGIIVGWVINLLVFWSNHINIHTIIWFFYYTNIKISFEWDDKKDRENQIKHGVSFYEAQQAFLDFNRLIAEDIEHSEHESRYYCFGKFENEIMTVRFTYRGHKIRIIGAGYWRKGRKIYEQERG